MLWVEADAAASPRTHKEFGTGSPASVVDAPVFCVSVKGSVVITVALAKLSLAAGLPTVKVSAPLFPPPGPGLTALTGTDAPVVSKLAGTVTVIDVAVHEVGVSRVLPN